MHKIALIIGHNQESQGASNKNLHISEFMFNSYLAKLVQFQLNQLGLDAFLLYRDKYANLPAKVNKTKAALAISFHCNAFDTKAHGSEVLYYRGSKKGKLLAGLLQENIVKALGSTDRGLKPCNHSYVGSQSDRGGYLLKFTHMPCVIIEPFFIDCDDSLIKAQNSFYALAEAYTKGIHKYLLKELTYEV